MNRSFGSVLAFVVLVAASVGVAAAGCIGNESGCESDSDCFQGESCVEGPSGKQCVATEDLVDDAGGDAVDTRDAADAGTDTDDAAEVDAGDAEPPEIDFVSPEMGTRLDAGEHTFQVRVDEATSEVAFEFVAEGDSSPAVTKSGDDLTKTQPESDDWVETWQTVLAPAEQLGSGDLHKLRVVATDTAGNETTSSLTFGVDTAPSVEFVRPSADAISSELETLEVAVDDDRPEEVEPVVVEFCRTGGEDSSGCDGEPTSVELTQSDDDPSRWVLENFADRQPVPDETAPVSVQFSATVTDAAGQSGSAEKTVQFEPYCGDGKQNGSEVCDFGQSPRRCCGGSDAPTDVCGSDKCVWAPGVVDQHQKLVTQTGALADIVDIEVTSDGEELYVAGEYDDVLEICGQTNTAEGVNAYVAKFSPPFGKSNCEWLADYGGSGGTWITDLEIGATGDLYAVGDFLGEIQGPDPFWNYLNSGNTRDVWFSRIESGQTSGDERRALFLQNAGDGHSKDLAVHSAVEDRLLIVGSKPFDDSGGATETYWLSWFEYAEGIMERQWEATGDRSLPLEPKVGMFRMVSGGEEVVVVGDASGQHGQTIRIDGADGSSSEISTTGTQDVFAATFDVSGGAVQSLARIGDGDSRDEVRAATLDSNGNVWVGMDIEANGTGGHAFCGSAVQEAVAVGNLGQAPAGDVTPSPVNCLDSSGSVGLTDMVVDDSDRLYVAGGYQGTLTFDLGAGSPSVSNTKTAEDPFVVSYDSSLSQRWHTTMSGGGLERAVQLGLGGTAHVFGALTYENELTVAGKTYQTGSGRVDERLLFSLFR